jgi:enterochelin esterase-like enzyme
MLLLVSAGLHGQSVKKPDLPRMKPSEAATAYKKQIGREPSTWQWNIPVELPHVTHGVVHSASMDRDIGYNIYLPPGYAEKTTTRYPVVYYLHGATGSETSDTPVVEYVISEIASGRIGEVLYVFVNAGHFSGYRDNPDSGVLAETYLIQELIPEIDRRYRTIASRKGRALMGFSMGGGGATRLALKHPDLFCAMVSFAGAMDANPEEGESAADERMQSDPANSVYHWASVHEEKIKNNLALYFFVGGEDRLYGRNAAFMEYLHQQGIPFDYRVMAGLGHDLWGSMALCGSEAVRFLASHYEQARAAEK